MEQPIIGADDDARALTREWQEWLQTVAGRYMLDWEQRECDQLVADLFGFHALQCGMPELESLRANRMPDRILALDPLTMHAGRGVPRPASSTPSAATDAGQTPAGSMSGSGAPPDPSSPAEPGDRQTPSIVPAAQASQPASDAPGGAALDGSAAAAEVWIAGAEIVPPRAVTSGASPAAAGTAGPAGAAKTSAATARDDPAQRLLPVPTVNLLGPASELRLERFEDLPFAESSIDLIVLPHVLEFTSDPHRVLREAARVLRPEGRIVVCGFNPLSLWGARHIALGFLPTPFVPKAGPWLGMPRLRDWLKLLGFEIGAVRYGCYRPAFRSDTWLQRTEFLEHAGDRWWPILGAVYMVTAVKRVHGMRIIGPSWRRARAQRARVAVASPQFNGSDDQRYM